jgi:homoserine kinase type II
MTTEPLVLSKSDLAELAVEYGLPKLAASSGAMPGWGHKRYLLDTSKGTHELRVRDVEQEVDLRRELDLLAFLEKHNFPSPRLVTDRRGRQFLERDGHYLVVFRIPSGQHPTGESLTLRQINNFGHALGELHTIGRGYKKAIENRFGFERIFETYAAVRCQMPPYFKRIVRTLDEETEYLGNYLETKLPKGIIHGTLYKGNIAFKGENVSCISDFDAACRGKYIYDLATVVNALCSSDGVYTLDRFEALMAGYESIRTLSLAEWDSFPNELRFAALRFSIVRLHEFFNADQDEARRINDEFREYLQRLRVLRREREGGMEGLLMAMATGYDYRKYQRVKPGDEEFDEPA